LAPEHGRALSVPLALSLEARRSIRMKVEKKKKAEKPTKPKQR